MRQAGEPTVEEILESIKEVIARDNRVGAAAERRSRAVEGVTETRITALPDEPEDEILDLAEADECVDEDDSHDSAETPSTPLVSAGAQAGMRESLAMLAMMAEPGAQPQIVRSGETSLEGMARDLLRPALSEWLDKNLPALVERMVADEIARIVGKRG